MSFIFFIFHPRLHCSIETKMLGLSPLVKTSALLDLPQKQGRLRGQNKCLAGSSVLE